MEDPQDDRARRVSVREMVKLIGENKRPIFLPKEAVARNSAFQTIDENSILEANKDVDDDSTTDDDDESISSSIHDFTSDEDEITDRNEMDEFLNMPEIIHEVQTFLWEEENYCQVLKDLVENYISTLQTDKLNILDVFGRIDIICSHHNNTFLPDLKKSKNALKIAHCFLKCKTFFNTYYDSYFKNQPNMIFVMIENKDLFSAHHAPKLYKQYEDILQKAPIERMQSYKLFLETTKNILSEYADVSSFDRALAMISKLTKNFTKKEETARFNISEMVETERVYIEKLERITQKVIPKIQDTIRIKRRHKSIVGNVPSIYINQLNFYEDLKKCLFAFDPNEVADCFLRNKEHFMLYIQDQQMKNDPAAMEECKELLKQDNQRDVDFHAPLNRLYKYKLLLQELQKSCVKGGIPFGQVEKALGMIGEIISQMNATAAINSIIDENIYLYEQGKLVLRGEFSAQYKLYENDKADEYDASIYLFEKAIVFTERRTEGHSRNRRDVFIYKHHIITKQLGLVANDLSERTIYLHFHGRSKKHFYALQAKDKATRDVWMKGIENILMKQFMEEKETN